MNFTTDDSSDTVPQTDSPAREGSSVATGGSSVDPGGSGVALGSSRVAPGSFGVTPRVARDNAPTVEIIQQRQHSGLTRERRGLPELSSGMRSSGWYVEFKVNKKPGIVLRQRVSTRADFTPYARRDEGSGDTLPPIPVHCRVTMLPTERAAAQLAAVDAIETPLNIVPPARSTLASTHGHVGSSSAGLGEVSVTFGDASRWPMDTSSTLSCGYSVDVDPRSNRVVRRRRTEVHFRSQALLFRQLRAIGENYAGDQELSAIMDTWHDIFDSPSGTDPGPEPITLSNEDGLDLTINPPRAAAHRTLPPSTTEETREG